MFQFAEVGGAVRDKFLGLNSKDVDFVAFLKDPEINSDAESTFNNLVQHLEKQEFKIFLVVPEFFTIRAQVPDNHPLKFRTNVADFVLARRDGPSSDGRHPDYVLPGSLLDDLQRRDFTVNAMALLNGELIDPFNGKKDLDDNLLRFVGDPMERIREDGLRVMRAIRFYITKGFDVEAHTWDSVNSDFAAEMLQKVSIERIHNELEKMFFFNTIKSIDAINCLNDRVKAAIFRESLHLIPSLKTKP